jgi:Tol biopolymer transport system component
MTSSPKQKEELRLPGIFISYRRSDNPDATGRIYDRLIGEFGRSRVFKDVDSIPLGLDFRGHLNQVVGGCAVVLAIIGPHWADVRNGAGQRRLEDAEDFVRVELEAALARDIPVVPVLVGHATMPGTADLPASLAPIAYRQSIEVRPDPDFHNDATRLLASLRTILDPNAPPLATPTAASAKRSRSRQWMIACVVSTLVAVVLAIPALHHLRETPAPEILTEITVPADEPYEPSIALSPDGRMLAFVATTQGVSRLWLRVLNAASAQPLAGTEGATYAFWSPDSRSIGFGTPTALKRTDVDGGARQTLAPLNNGYGGSWSADGIILFSAGNGKGLCRVRATGGPVVEVTHLGPNALFHVSPLFLPDGHRFVYVAAGGGAEATYLGSLDGAAPVRLTTAAGNVAWFPGGWLLIWDRSQRALVAQRLDANKRVLVGDPVTLEEGTSGTVTASASGLVAYWKSVPLEIKRQLRWRSRTGADLGSIGEPNYTDDYPRLSPDGRRVALLRGENGRQDIWLLDGARASRVTFHSGQTSYAIFSPDGKQIAFSATRAGADGIYAMPADGAAAEQLLLRLDGPKNANSWSPDGRFLLYSVISPGTLFDVGVIPMALNRKPWMLLNSPSSEYEAQFSPDGKWVAYESDETGQAEIFLRPFLSDTDAPAARSGKWQVSTSGGAFPKWSSSGNELFFLDSSGAMMSASISFTNSALTVGAPVKLFQTRNVSAGRSTTPGAQYDVSRDGRFLINEVSDASVSPIILIQNWNPAAKMR